MDSLRFRSRTVFFQIPSLEWMLARAPLCLWKKISHLSDPLLGSALKIPIIIGFRGARVVIAQHKSMLKSLHKNLLHLPSR
jgi:hypothetical protein